MSLGHRKAATSPAINFAPTTPSASVEAPLVASLQSCACSSRPSPSFSSNSSLQPTSKPCTRRSEGTELASPTLDPCIFHGSVQDQAARNKAPFNSHSCAGAGACVGVCAAVGAGACTKGASVAAGAGGDVSACASACAVTTAPASDLAPLSLALPVLLELAVMGTTLGTAGVAGAAGGTATACGCSAAVAGCSTTPDASPPLADLPNQR
mmetsp:Transcript_85697/g.148097  ORF Transcript_85697/g.148097 Transcript_85697/m.148097 type:complete len:210 (-) Transcript_85697:144-773(-)